MKKKERAETGCGLCCTTGSLLYKRREFIRLGSLAALAVVAAPVANAAKLPLIAVPVAAVKQTKPVKISILHTADLHGQTDVHDEFFWENGKAAYHQRGGFATLKTMVDSLRAQNPDGTLLIDGGDCIQGSGIASLSEGKAMIPLINYINYDVVIPGNWEVVYGKEMLISDFNSYSAAKICANMLDSGTEAEKLLFAPYKIFIIKGVKIGFIGYTDPLTAIRQAPAYSRGIRFSKPEESLARYVKELREVQGCTIIIVLSHMGLMQDLHLADQECAKGVDFILGADTHERVRVPLQGRYCKVSQPGAFGSFISKLDLEVEQGKITSLNYELLDTDPAVYKPDRVMQQLIADARKPYEAHLSQVIGQISTPLVRYYIIETPMDNLITDAIKDRLKTDIALSNGFRFCPPLVPGPQTGTADITYNFLWSMLPVNSLLKTALVSGKQLSNWLEEELEKVFAKDASKRFGGWLVRFSGMKLIFTIGVEKGRRIQSLSVNGEAVSPERIYSIAACERDGDREDLLCRIPSVALPHSSGLLLHDVVAAYIGSHSPVAPQIEGRAKATDASQYLLTQATPGVDYQFR